MKHDVVSMIKDLWTQFHVISFGRQQTASAWKYQRKVHSYPDMQAWHKSERWGLFMSIFLPPRSQSHRLFGFLHFGQDSSWTSYGIDGCLHFLILLVVDLRVHMRRCTNGRYTRAIMCSRAESHFELALIEGRRIGDFLNTAFNAGRNLKTI